MLVAHLSENFYYFLYSPEACEIFNDLYELIQFDMTGDRQFMVTASTGWARAIGIFLLNGRDKLLSAELYLNEEGKMTHLIGIDAPLEAFFPDSGSSSLPKNLNYIPNLMGNLMDVDPSTLLTKLFVPSIY